LENPGSKSEQSETSCDNHNDNKHTRSRCLKFIGEMTYHFRMAHENTEEKYMYPNKHVIQIVLIK